MKLALDLHDRPARRPGRAPRRTCGSQRLATRYTANMPRTSTSCVCMEPNASMPKRRSTPASIAAASAPGMRLMALSNQPVTPDDHDEGGAHHERPDRLGHRHPGDARHQHGGSRRRPGGEDGHPVVQRKADRRRSHAEAEHHHPRGDLGGRRVQSARGLKDDHGRARDADEHRDKPGRDRGDREVFEEAHPGRQFIVGRARSRPPYAPPR